MSLRNKTLPECRGKKSRKSYMIQIIANSGKLTKEDQIVPVPQARQALLRVEAVGVGSVD